jgi:hypothetical protein
LLLIAIVVFEPRGILGIIDRLRRGEKPPAEILPVGDG